MFYCNRCQITLCLDSNNNQKVKKKSARLHIALVFSQPASPTCLLCRSALCVQVKACTHSLFFVCVRSRCRGRSTSAEHRIFSEAERFFTFDHNQTTDSLHTKSEPLLTVNIRQSGRVIFLCYTLSLWIYISFDTFRV